MLRTDSPKCIVTKFLDESNIRLPNSKSVSPASNNRFQIKSPINGGIIAELEASDFEQSNHTVNVARSAFDANRGISPLRRKEWLYSLYELVVQHHDELAVLETVDNGKTIASSTTIDIPSVAQCFRFYAECCDKRYGKIPIHESGYEAQIKQRPLGVIAAILPWNYPLLMAAWKLAPALASGNAVILKPSEKTCLSMLKLIELVKLAGIPEGLVQCLIGPTIEPGEWLGKHRGIDAITFTGSTTASKHFYRYAAQSTHKQLSLECGGKSAQIILDDCPDMETAARAVARGVFSNQGAVCNAGSRLILSDKIHDSFIEKLLLECEHYQPSNPLHKESKNGAIIDKEHAEHILSDIAQALQDGAALLTGGRCIDIIEGGYYIAPTVLTNVTPNMPIAKKEVFGPVLLVMRANTTEEAVALANSTAYGLAASVWTSNLRTAHECSNALEAGIIWINCFDKGSMSMPFGGWKESGYGPDKGLEAMDKYTRTQSVWTNYQL